jgi:Spy/CpxP family protein refolding chaperone
VSADLNLTPDQKTKLEPILTNEIQMVHSLRADTSMTPEQKQTKFKDQLTSDHAKIDAILTPEQKQKLAQLTQQRQQQQQQASPSTPPQTPKP